MKNLENLKLSFPELEDSVKQSTKGGWNGYSGGWGNYGGYGDPSNPFVIDEVIVSPGGNNNGWVGDMAAMIQATAVAGGLLTLGRLICFQLLLLLVTLDFF